MRSQGLPYLVLHANRTTGILARKIATIAGDMHMSERTVQSWLARLRKAGYVIVRNSGRSLEIHIQNGSRSRYDTDEKDPTLDLLIGV